MEFEASAYFIAGADGLLECSESDGPPFLLLLQLAEILLRLCSELRVREARPERDLRRPLEVRHRGWVRGG